MSSAEERKAKRLAKRRSRLARFCPEFALFPTAEDAKRAQRELTFAMLRWPSTWVTTAIAALIVIPLAIILTRVLAHLGVPDFFYSVITGGLAGCAGALGLRLPVRKRSRRFLRQCLIERGVPVCLHCGYDLRGQTAPRCPECGQPFDPMLLRPTDHPTPNAAAGETSPSDQPPPEAP
ncbi:MAG: hypothetical protein PVJ57_15655 [Phycisphaerae bacterium]|jgi:hypothetical protein